jgi:hypothetical protein
MTRRELAPARAHRSAAQHFGRERCRFTRTDRIVPPFSSLPRASSCLGLSRTSWRKQPQPGNCAKHSSRVPLVMLSLSFLRTQ